MPFGLGGRFFQPDAILGLHPDYRVQVEAVTDLLGSDFTEGGEAPGVALLARTDAPPAVLGVTPRVRVGGSSEPGIIEIHALPDSPAADLGKIYRIWLEEDPSVDWAPGWGPDIDPTPLRVRIREAPPDPTCGHLELAVRAGPESLAGGIRAVNVFGELATDYRRVEVTLRTDHPGASLDLLSGYRPLDRDPEPDEPARANRFPALFALDLDFRELPPGFEQTMALGVFDGVRLAADAPGCVPVEIECDQDARCRTGRGP